MKDKITIFIIGLLLGSVISTASIYFYTLANNNSNNENNSEMQGPRGNHPEMQNGQFGENGNPPEIPNGNSSQNGA